MRPIFFALLCTISVALPSLAPAQDAAKDLSVAAQKECDAGRIAKPLDGRRAHFERSVALAERALAIDDQVAAAHFALFCAVGEQIRLDGETFSPLKAFGFRRMMRALDRTLELEPAHLDAQSAKGTLLVRLPALLGGDRPKGEAMLRRVIDEFPRSINARLALAKSYAAHGNRQEATTLAADAMRFALADQREDLLPEAQDTLRTLHPSHPLLSTAHR